MSGGRSTTSRSLLPDKAEVSAVIAGNLHKCASLDTNNHEHMLTLSPVATPATSTTTTIAKPGHLHCIAFALSLGTTDTRTAAGGLVVVVVWRKKKRRNCKDK
uniref:Uncharacterized protein n=1 Tax=Oryza punctata TaxID=4537 RepID=A0A0E0JID5_ORYPU